MKTFSKDLADYSFVSYESSVENFCLFHVTNGRGVRGTEGGQETEAIIELAKG